MTESNAAKSKREAVRRISRDTGMSESSIYKILANPLNFSKSTVDEVQEAARRYGLTLTGAGPAAALGGHTTAPSALRICVVIPSRPLYFWKEAVAGIEKSKSRLEAELGVTIRLRYSYQNTPTEESAVGELMASLSDDPPDGLIIYPMEGEACRRYLEGSAIPTVIFNDTRSYMTDAWFQDHPHTAFIGPDGYEEGCRAAALLAGGAPIRHLTVICTGHDSSMVSTARIRGVCEETQRRMSAARISHIRFTPAEPVTPAALARRLVRFYNDDNVDCLYISSGITHIACAAIEKIERRLGRPLSTFVIGHECSTADRRYLMEGRQRGYIKQDVYSQGLHALRDVVNACLAGTPLSRRLYPPSVFIR